ncbi:MAG: DegT/DnrJ/EryC1/StrS family aminotransferase [Gemmatimonadales bacterium]
MSEVTRQAPPRLPVRFQQVLPLGAALGAGRPTAVMPFPLDQPGVVTTFSGTAAVYQAFRALRLPAGSVVLCPSYNCGHEIEPLLRLGLTVRCYRVTSEMEADVEDVRRRMGEEVRAVLVTHFFGFGQRLEELRVLCDRWGASLIEDCAHALLSDNAVGNLGRMGDAAVFSIRKTLPLPNGGAALFNRKSLRVDGTLEAPPRLTTWLKAVSLTRKSALDAVAGDRSWRSLASVAAMAPVVAGNAALRRIYPETSAVCYDPDDESYDFRPEILDWGMSAFSLAAIGRIEWGGIAARRRHNYRVLADALSRLDGVRLVRSDVADCVCPLFLPLVVRRREEVYAYLLRRRIHAAIWWDQKHPAVNWADFPEASDLKNHVLALPIHQDLDDAQLEYVAEALGSCSFL